MTLFYFSCILYYERCHQFQSNIICKTMVVVYSVNLKQQNGTKLHENSIFGVEKKKLQSNFMQIVMLALIWQE